MALTVKIMLSNTGNDEHPASPHIIISDVARVTFNGTRSPEPGVYIQDVSIFFPEGSNQESYTQQLQGNVYVMNESGKTISRYHVDKPRMDAWYKERQDKAKAMIKAHEEELEAQNRG